MLVTKTIQIDMGHRVPNHKSKCKNLHGHRYVIEVGVDDNVILEKGVSNEGMVIDFGDLKEIMMTMIHDIYDHSFVMSTEDNLKKIFLKLVEQEQQKIVFVPFVPTAENLSKHWYKTIEKKLLEKKIKLKYIKVWETPSSTATYEE